MNKITGNEPAYPLQDKDEQDRLCSPKFGLTKREVFARAAMQGILSNSDYTITLSNQFSGEKFNEAVATDAVSYADALIDKLNETPNE